MTNIGSPIGALEMSEAQAAAHKLGLEVLPLEIRRAEDIAPAFEALRGDAQALYVVSEPLAGTNMVRINTLAWDCDCRRCMACASMPKREA